jgi:nitrogen fixation-related uncharacterized protein
MPNTGRNHGCNELHISLDRLSMLGYIIASLALGLTGAIAYIFFWKKGQFEDMEDVKYDLLRQDDQFFISSASLKLKKKTDQKNLYRNALSFGDEPLCNTQSYKEPIQPKSTLLQEDPKSIMEDSCPNTETRLM